MSWFIRQSKWKIQEYPEHKFDYINVYDYINDTLIMRFKYAGVFLSFFKDVFVYCMEIAIVVLRFFPEIKTVLAFDPDIPRQTMVSMGPNESVLPSDIARVSNWLVLASVCASYILLVFDLLKASRTIKSKDISFSYIDTVAYRAYCLHSFAFFCFFDELAKWKRARYYLSFFVLFAFKGWKRLFFAEAMRHFLNFCALLDLFQLHGLNENKQFSWFELLEHLGKDQILPAVVIVFASITIFVFLVRVFLLIVAFILYVPFLCFEIQGNLKEYCCHIIDERMTVLNRETERRKYLLEKHLTPSISGDCLL